MGIAISQHLDSLTRAKIISVFICRIRNTVIVGPKDR